MTGTSTTTLGNNNAAGIEVTEGCPICEHVWNEQFDILAQLQFDVYKEGEPFLEDNGLYAICSRHLRMLNRISSSKGSAKMLGYLIQKSLNGNLFRQFERKCPICERLEAFDKTEVLKAARAPLELAKGDFVCLDHLRKILDVSQPEDKEKILSAYKDSLTKLFEQLKVLSVENYYQTGAEVRSSLWRSLEKLAGRE
jgi:hypothetical protein